MKKIVTPILLTTLLLTGCGGTVGTNKESSEAPSFSSSATTSSSRPATPPTVSAAEREAKAQASASASASSAAAALKVRYEFSCGPKGSLYGADATKFNTAPEIWASAAYPTFGECSVEIGGDWAGNSSKEIPLLPSEDAVVDSMALNGGDVSRRDSAFSSALKACALPPEIGWEKSRGPDVRRVQAIASAALTICPDAPFASELQRISQGTPPAVIRDGTSLSGKDMQAGTYQVQVPNGANGVHNCYWERTDSFGNTIANDFLTFAPQGPVVSIADGEGFVSKGCGTWALLN